MHSKIELIVIKNALESAEVEISYGDDLTTLLRQAFDTPTLPSGIRLYHEHFGKEITPKTPADVDNLMIVQGKIIAVVAPQGLDPVSWLIIGVSVLVSVGVALMLPKMMAQNINTTHNQPPSPNNALASRTNSQRLGGRVPVGGLNLGGNASYGGIVGMKLNVGAGNNAPASFNGQTLGKVTEKPTSTATYLHSARGSKGNYIAQSYKNTVTLLITESYNLPQIGVIMFLTTMGFYQISFANQDGSMIDKNRTRTFSVTLEISWGRDNRE